jgi:D-serine deaminase-like pyridoxal phosphate-dependent protein
MMPAMKVEELRTPALLMDLDGMENNLSRMAAFFRDKEAKLGPHFKAHQVLTLALKQLRAGAIGITCARLEQAEGLVHQGTESILIANEIAGMGMINRRYLSWSH